MTKFILKTVDHTGNTVAENDLTVSEGSIFILNPPEGERFDVMEKMHKSFVGGLENDNRVFTLLPGFKLQVINVE